MKRPALFFDKDGTLIEDVPYNVSPDRIRMVAGAERALRRLAATDYELFIVTNQPGVAHGYFAPTALKEVHASLSRIFARNGARLAGFYYCPHHPEGVVPHFAQRCGCRKPAPGLIVDAAREHAIDLGRSWFVGDILHDVEAGRRAGCRTVLIDNGNETEWQLSPMRTPDYIAPNIEDAVQHILAPQRNWAGAA